MKRIKYIFLFTVFMTLHFLLLSQVYQSQFIKRCPVKTINYEQGLLNNGTTNIITDTLGFTWISTKTGMQRYNGYVLETINPVIDKKIIPINSPQYFFAWQNGLVWISYKQGVLEYDPYINSFKKIIAADNSANLNFSVIPFKETAEGVWCMQFKKGLVLYTHNGTILKTILTSENSFVQNVFSQQEIWNNSTFTANQSSIFIYNRKDRIQQVNFQTKHIDYFNADHVYSFTCSNNNLYMISNKAITRININAKKTEKNIPLKEIITENLIYGSVFMPGKNQLLISLNGHLFQFDTACNYQKEFTGLTRNPLVTQGFVRTIYTDRFKRIWLLTNDDIKRIQNFDIPFEHFMYANEKNNFVRSIYYDERKHLLLAGCYNGGIQLYDTLGNALWEKAISSENVKDINAIEKLTEHNYLIETFGKGWYILNLPLKNLKPFLLNDSMENKIHSHSINFINNIQRINDSAILIATSSNVFICIFKKEKLGSVEPLLPVGSPFSEQINCFVYSSDKTLWIGTANGTLYQVRKNKHSETIHIPENYQIRSLTEDARHNIWVGTDKGLYVYNNSGAPIKNITTQSGLLNDCMYALLPVENKPAVFASSNLGISYVSLNEDIINYTKESGLQEDEFNTGSAVETSAGKFYFGGVNGITAFYPASLSNIEDMPVLNITKLVVNDSLYSRSSGIWIGDSIFLKYSQNHIQIDFAAIGLLNANEYVYKYRLKGFEQTWQTTHQPTGIKYILQPGEYTLEISYSPILSTNSIFTKKIMIVIAPPWWQTWWFNILVISFAITIIAFIVQQYLHRRYQKKLRALKLQHEIQQERERISRDLHDNLGAYAAAIASNVSAIQASQNDKNVLYQLKNNSQSIITQLNDTIWALNKEAISLTAVSDRFKLFLQKIQPNFPGIYITVEENILNDQTLSPANALHLFRIMQESVNNALRHSDCSNVTIQINSSDTWNVTIKDDGKGFTGLNEKLVKGNGLKNIRSRGEEAGWKITWKDAYPKGTELTVNDTRK